MITFIIGAIIFILKVVAVIWIGYLIIGAIGWLFSAYQSVTNKSQQTNNTWNHETHPEEARHKSLLDRGY